MMMIGLFISTLVESIYTYTHKLISGIVYESSPKYGEGQKFSQILELNDFEKKMLTFAILVRKLHVSGSISITCSITFVCDCTIILIKWRRSRHNDGEKIRRKLWDEKSGGEERE